MSGRKLVGALLVAVLAQVGGLGQAHAADPITRTITLTQPPDKLASDAPFSVTATTNPPGGVVSYATTTSSVCTIGGASPVVTLVGAGLCTVTATVEASSTHTGDSDTKSFAVRTPRTVTLPTIGDKVRTVDPSPFDPAATTSPTGGSITYTTSTPGVCGTSGAPATQLTLVGSGTCTVTATVLQTGTHTGDTDTKSFAVLTKRTVTLPTLADRLTTAANTPVTATSAPTGTISYAAGPAGTCVIVNPNQIDVGSTPGLCTVTARVDRVGSPTFVAAGQDTTTFRVLSARTVTLAQPDDKLTTSADVQVSATANPAGTIAYSAGPAGVCSATGDLVDVLAAGVCSVTASVAQDDDANVASGSDTKTFRIRNTRTVTVTDPGTTPFGTPDLTPSATIVPAAVGTVTYTAGPAAVCSMVAGKVHLAGLGSCTLTADVPQDSGAEGKTGFTTFTVDPEIPTVTITVAPTTSHWKDSFVATVTVRDVAGNPVAGTGTITVSSEGAVTTAAPASWPAGDATMTFTGTRAGTATVTATFEPTNTTLFQSTSKTRSVVLTKAAQTASFKTPGDILYVDHTWTSPATLTSGLDPVLDSNNSRCSISGQTVTFETAGACTLSASHPGSVDYLLAPEVTKPLTIVKRPVTVTAVVQTASPRVGTPVELALTATDGSPVGLGEAVPGTFTVDLKNSAGTTISSGTVTPGATDGTATFRFTPATGGPHSYIIRFTPASGVAYKFTYTAPVTRTPLTVALIQQVVTVDDSDLTPDGDVGYVTHGGSVSLTGTSGGGTLTLTSSTTPVCTVGSPVADGAAQVFAISYVAAGTCTLSARQEAITGTHDASPIKTPGTQVDKIPVRVEIVSAPPTGTTVGQSVSMRLRATGKFGEAVQGTGGVVVQRLVGGSWTEDRSQPSVTWTAGTRLITFTPPHAGTYRVTDTWSPDAVRASTFERDGTAGNVPPSFTVAKASQTVQVLNAPTSHRTALTTWTPQVSLGAPTGLVIAASSPVCSVAAGTVTFDTAGTCTVSFSHPGNDDYLPASAPDVVVEVDHVVTTTQVQWSGGLTVGTAKTVVLRAVDGAGRTVPGTFENLVFPGDSPFFPRAPVASASGRSEVRWTPVQVAVDHLQVSFDPSRADVYLPSGADVLVRDVAPGTRVITLNSELPTTDAVVGGEWHPRVGVVAGPAVPAVVLRGTSGVCVPVNGTIAMLAEGQCEVTAVAPATTDWLESAAISRSFRIALKGVRVRITSAPLDVVVGSDDESVVATVTGVEPPSSTPGAPATSFVPGLVTFTATLQDSDPVRRETFTAQVVAGALDADGHAADGAATTALSLPERGRWSIEASFAPRSDVLGTWQAATDRGPVVEATRRTQSVDEDTLDDVPPSVQVLDTWLSDVVVVDADGSKRWAQVAVLTEGSGAAPCEVDDDLRTVTFTAAGECNLSFGRAADTDYEAAPALPRSIQVRLNGLVVTLPKPASPKVGQESTLAATVTRALSASANAPLPDGSLRVVEVVPGSSTRPVGTTDVTDGVADPLTWTPRLGGAQTLVATFEPASATSGYPAQTTASTPLDVAKAPPRLDLSVRANGVPQGDFASVTLAATTPGLDGVVAPTGTVTFYEVRNGVTSRIDEAPMTARGATLAAFLPSGTAVSLEAVYSGDANYSGNDNRPATLVRGLPVVELGAIREPDHDGWYTSPVTVRFTCTKAPGVTIVGGCPDPAVVDDDGRDQRVRGVLTTSDGARVSYASLRVDVDTTRPTVEILGFANGEDFRGRSPVVRCAVSDPTSGGGPCRLTSKKVGDRVVYTATATNGAGLTREATSSYQELRQWVVDAPLDAQGRFRAKPGSRVEVRALTTEKRPQLKLPAAGGGWREGGPVMVPTAIGNGLITWYATTTLPKGLSGYRLGVKVDGEQIRVLRLAPR